MGYTDPEKQKAYDAARYAANREAIKARVRDRRIADPAADSERQRRWREKNPDRLKADKARWNQSPEGRASIAAGRSRRRARLRDLDCGCVTPQGLREVWESTGGLCAYCSMLAEHYEHLTPLARGGRHCLDNLAPACADCNRRKGTLTVDEFWKVAR